MEYVSLVDTSLDLNANPRRLIDDAPIKKEVQSNFIDHLGRNVSAKEETDALVEELNRVSAENKKLTEMLTVLGENYNALQSHVADYMSKNPGRAVDPIVSRKRKAESTATTATNNKNNNDCNINDGATNGGNSESSSSDEDSCKKPRQEHVDKAKISRVYVRTEASDRSLLVKDGYQWRKYGQKVTRDNPCPRAYFKCSFAPTCPVKKKVQRSIEDQSVLVATYDGEHNHPHPSRIETIHNNNNNDNTSSSKNSMTPEGPAVLPRSAASLMAASGPPTVSLDLSTIPYQLNNYAKNSTESIVNNSSELQQFLVEQMASSLTKDPGFKAAVASAISGRIVVQQNPRERW